MSAALTMGQGLCAGVSFGGAGLHALGPQACRCSETTKNDLTSFHAEPGHNFVKRRLIVNEGDLGLKKSIEAT